MRGVDVAGRQWRRNIASWTGEGHGIRTCRGELLPDLSDPATVGCLLALVREAWGDPCLHVGLLPARWGVWTSQNMPLHECVGKALTEAEALVAALEAAP